MRPNAQDTLEVSIHFVVGGHTETGGGAHGPLKHDFNGNSGIVGTVWRERRGHGQDSIEMGQHLFIASNLATLCQYTYPISFGIRLPEGEGQMDP